jgi:hypothetical protein
MGLEHTMAFLSTSASPQARLVVLISILFVSYLCVAIYEAPVF